MTTDVDTEETIPNAYRVEPWLCDDCDCVHLDLLDPDDEPIATAVMPIKTVEWLIDSLEVALKRLRRNLASQAETQGVN